MTLVAPESFRQLNSGTEAVVAGPALHHLHILVDPVVLAKPFALAAMFGDHRFFHVKNLGYIDDKIRATFQSK